MTNLFKSKKSLFVSFLLITVVSIYWYSARMKASEKLKKEEQKTEQELEKIRLNKGLFRDNNGAPPLAEN